MSFAKPWVVILLATMLSACAPSPRPVAPAVAEPRPACRAGTDARGIAAAFFAFVQDRPECF